MHFLICIIGFALICNGADLSGCPTEGGFVCYPNDCGDQYQQCIDHIYHPPQPTPQGFLCREGLFVVPSSCSLGTLCSQPSCSLSQIFSQSDFDELFPFANGGAKNNVANQHAVFDYSKLIAAAIKFPEFACTGSAEERKRELAAFLAHTSQETSGWWYGQPYYWGFYYSTEIGCNNTACTQYCNSESTDYPCVAEQGYFGRGPIQLSWNYNYGQMSEALFGNKDILLNDPDLLFSGSTAFESALWFWMTPQAPKPSCHDVITGQWTPSEADENAGREPGFGLTTNIINGLYECTMRTLQPTENRVQYFETYADVFGVSTGINLYCEDMQHY